jgi:ABC-type sugar transport system substrate-binding protein
MAAAVRHEPRFGTAVGAGREAIGTLRALRDLSLQQAIAVVSFDDVPFGDVIQPGLTVMVQDPIALGRHAAELLFEHTAGAPGPSPEWWSPPDSPRAAPARSHPPPRTKADQLLVANPDACAPEGWTGRIRGSAGRSRPIVPPHAAWRDRAEERLRPFSRE